jgi:hypothetical protein
VIVVRARNRGGNGALRMALLKTWGPVARGKDFGPPCCRSVRPAGGGSRMSRAVGCVRRDVHELPGAGGCLGDGRAPWAPFAWYAWDASRLPSRSERAPTDGSKRALGAERLSSRPAGPRRIPEAAEVRRGCGVPRWWRAPAWCGVKVLSPRDFGSLD